MPRDHQQCTSRARTRRASGARHTMDNLWRDVEVGDNRSGCRLELNGCSSSHRAFRTSERQQNPASSTSPSTPTGLYGTLAK